MRLGAVAGVTLSPQADDFTILILKHSVATLEPGGVGIGDVMRQNRDFLIRRIKPGTDDIKHGDPQSNGFQVVFFQIPCRNININLY